MRRPGRVVAKSVLEEKLYGIDDEHGSNTIPVHVHHLRRKLLVSYGFRRALKCGANVEIHTVRGVGYLLTGIDE
jgi:DNA-binding response OmpR family regulator